MKRFVKILILFFMTMAISLAYGEIVGRVTAINPGTKEIEIDGVRYKLADEATLSKIRSGQTVLFKLTGDTITQIRATRIPADMPKSRGKN